VKLSQKSRFAKRAIVTPDAEDAIVNSKYLLPQYKENSASNTDEFLRSISRLM